MTDREKIISVATACLNTKEGSKEHQTIVDIYNQHKPKNREYKLRISDPWCAAFVSAVYIAAGLSAAIPIDCSCFYMKNLSITTGQVRDPVRYVPKPGDLVLYKWDGKKISSRLQLLIEKDYRY